MANKGILGRKLGMTQVFDDANRVVPVSVVEAGPCRVVQLKTPERDGYTAVQLAFGDTKASRLNKPELGHLKAAGGPPQQYLAELRVDDLSNFELGQVIAADVFNRSRVERARRSSWVTIGTSPAASRASSVRRRRRGTGDVPGFSLF